jgi:hypothetical protein
VFPRTGVVERRDQIVRAIEGYRRLSLSLVERYHRVELLREWSTAEHGYPCRFENRRTGQVVEAALPEWGEPDRVDPYCIAEFVQTTAGLESVAKLIAHKYHDGAWILVVLAESDF